MLKNKEITWNLCCFAILTACTCIALILFPRYAPAIGFLSGCLFTAVFLIYTRYRYNKIRELAGYLNHAAMGDYSLDLRDYREGELSYLKSEIYKVTLKLIEQSDLLLKDKTYLADTLSDISHQLKTPLTSMMMMADLMQDEDLPQEKRTEFSAAIIKQLQRIEWLVSTLLKMSKLDAHSIELKQENINLHQLLLDSASHLLIPMELKEQQFLIEGENTLHITGDPSWLREAFSNILKNCIEHTPVNGTISIRFTQNTIYTSIKIRDTGKGIAAQDLPHIFTRFYKGKDSAPNNVGIGLALAKQIINMHKGTIEVGSIPGESTEFHIKLYQVIV